MSDIHISQDFGRYASDPLRFHVEFSKDDHIGRNAKLEIISRVNVKDSDPANASRTLHTENFNITSKRFETTVPKALLPEFAYRGKKIDLQHVVRVTVDDAIFFDSKSEADLLIPALEREGSSLEPDAEKAMEPKDVYSLIRNLSVLSLQQKLAMIGAFVVGILGAVGNFLLYIYDAMITTSPLYYVSSDGTMTATGMGAFAGMAGFYMAYKRILRSYISVSLRKNIPMIEPGRDYRLEEFITAKSNIDLQNLTAQVVVATVEKGQYWRGSGTRRRRVEFSIPSRAVMVLDKTVSRVPKNAPVESYFSDRISFDDIFTHLYPHSMLSSTHGLSVTVEFRLMSDDYADIERHIGSKYFDPDDFMVPHETDQVS